jgi:hypothetical protein
VPFGALLYSLKALSSYNEDLVDGTIYPSTNANGHSIYEQCDTPCSTNSSLYDFLLEQEANPREDIFKTFPKVCQQFVNDFENPSHELRSLFHKGWLEPQSHVNITYSYYGKEKISIQQKRGAKLQLEFRRFWSRS